jgi:cell pole-organizing protein PopZ
MTQSAKAQEPSIEEILASIRRIISDDETKPAAVQAAPEPTKPEPSRAPPKAVPLAKAAPRVSTTPSPPVSAQTSQAAPKAPAAASPPVAKNSQGDIDAMLAGLDAETSEVEVRVAEPESDVFELTEQMTISEPSPVPLQQAVSLHQMDSRDEALDQRFVGKYDGSASVPGRSAFAEADDAPPARPLMSSSTMATVESAFNTLANTVLSNNARTLEDLVKEMLRPMLKSWLDDNLPNMVERIVRAEIERVSRGR